MWTVDARVDRLLINRTVVREQGEPEMLSPAKNLLGRVVALVLRAARVATVVVLLTFILPSPLTLSFQA